MRITFGVTSEIKPSERIGIDPFSPRGDRMTQVILGDDEGIESAIRRFKRKVSKAGIFPDMRKHRHFETPLEKHKRKEIARHRQQKKKFRY